MSSAAATRISTGNITGWARRGTPARSWPSTSCTDSRGTAYSDSTNRTRRGVTNTSCDGAEYLRVDSVAEASRLSGLISARHRAAGPAERAEGRVLHHLVLEEPPPARHRRRIAAPAPARTVRLFCLSSALLP